VCVRERERVCDGERERCTCFVCLRQTEANTRGIVCVCEREREREIKTVKHTHRACVCERKTHRPRGDKRGSKRGSELLKKCM
jgi:hypothetical protein